MQYGLKMEQHIPSATHAELSTQHASAAYVTGLNIHLSDSPSPLIFMAVKVQNVASIIAFEAL